jgi:hypothetical protein
MKNFYLYLVVITFSFFLFNLKTAHAALFINAPNYIGLRQGLVGSWTFNGPDMNAQSPRHQRAGESRNAHQRPHPRGRQTRPGH